MKQFFDEAAQQNHPLRVLKEFLERETGNETAKRYDELRFVGYALDINYFRRRSESSINLESVVRELTTKGAKNTKYI